MGLHTPLRGASISAAAALAAATVVITAPLAHAAPVFTDAQTILDPFAGANTFLYAGVHTCTDVPTIGTEPSVPVVENGPAASASTSASATFANSGIPGDTATGTASATGSGKVTSAGGNVSSLDLSVNSTSTLTNALGTSTECVRDVWAGLTLDFEFTVTNPGFLSVTSTNTGGAYGALEIGRRDTSSPDSQPYVESSGQGTKFNQTVKVFLPAGTYRGNFDGEVYKNSRSSYSITGTTTVHAEFHVAGSQTEAVSGKGKRYVTLPAARSCATHTLAASVTGKKHRADQIKQVTVFVNDHKVKRVRTPDKGDVVNVPLPDDVTADVRAEVKLFPRAKGRPGKVIQVSAAYEACS